jgi:hypothetical protein
MRFSRNSFQSWPLRIFVFFVVLTVVVYVLRGFAVLSMLPGSIIWALILLSIGTGIFAALQNMRGRY